MKRDTLIELYDFFDYFHRGEQRAIHMEEVSKLFNIDDRTCRKYIKAINNNEVQRNLDRGNNKIMGTVSGYFMINTFDEANHYGLLRYKRFMTALKEYKTFKQDMQENQIKFNLEDLDLEIIKEIREDMELLTIDELAAKLKISKATLYREIKKGLPYVMVGDTKRFIEHEVMTWLKSNTKNR